jgi:hypothetical protein
MPLFGWSEYSLEGAMISCSIEWNKRTPSVISYNVFIAIFVFLFSLLMFIFTNGRILMIVSILNSYFFDFISK